MSQSRSQRSLFAPILFLALLVSGSAGLFAQPPEPTCDGPASFERAVEHTLAGEVQAVLYFNETPHRRLLWIVRHFPRIQRLAVRARSQALLANLDEPLPRAAQLSALFRARALRVIARLESRVARALDRGLLDAGQADLLQAYVDCLRFDVGNAQVGGGGDDEPEPDIID